MNDMIPANPKHNRICAFCRHWYDPANSCIQPQTPIRWLYDRTAKKLCLKRNVPMQSWAGASCRYYEGKV